MAARGHVGDLGFIRTTVVRRKCNVLTVGGWANCRHLSHESSKHLARDVKQGLPVINFPFLHARFALGPFLILWYS